MMLRQRKKSSKAVEVIKQLDSFPKVSKDDFVERSRFGGTVSLLAHAIIVWILVFEINYYLEDNVEFKFMPDTDFDMKLPLNLDLIIAMPCHSIGADIVDSTSQTMHKFGSLDEEDTWFEMSPEQAEHFYDLYHFNTFLRTEYHAINLNLWKSRHSFHHRGLPERSVKPDYPPDACRIFGKLILNKVAGNFHVTAGKSLHLPESSGGHLHLPFLSQASYNFSHRILHLSFGDLRMGIINPLDGEEKNASLNSVLYQYFIEVVPTDIQTYFSQGKTYQYSVKETMRTIDHHKGSHGVPGIFFKYDMSPLKVVVSQAREPFLPFFIRLSSTIAGIYVSAGLLRDLILFLCKLGGGVTQPKTPEHKQSYLNGTEIVI